MTLTQLSGRLVKSVKVGPEATVVVYLERTFLRYGLLKGEVLIPLTGREAEMLMGSK